MDRGAWWTTTYGVAKSWTQLSYWAHTHIYTYIFIFPQILLPLSLSQNIEYSSLSLLNVYFIYSTCSFYLLIWLCWILVAAHGIFSCSMWTLSCGMWGLVPWPGIKPGPPALGAQRCSHWTTREIPIVPVLMRSEEISWMLPIAGDLVGSENSLHKCRWGCRKGGRQAHVPKEISSKKLVESQEQALCGCLANEKWTI